MKLDDNFHRNIKCTCTHIEGTLIETYISVTSLCLNEVVIGASVSEAPLVASTAILFLTYIYVVGARITRYVRTYVRRRRAHHVHSLTLAPKCSSISFIKDFAHKQQGRCEYILRSPIRGRVNAPPAPTVRPGRRPPACHTLRQARAGACEGLGPQNVARTAYVQARLVPSLPSTHAVTEVEGHTLRSLRKRV